MRLVIGIDPGVNTGFAAWNASGNTFDRVESMRIDQAIFTLRELALAERISHVVFEDARLRTGYFGPNSREKQQGAGSVKRDCKILADFLGANNIPYRAISPKAKGAKVDAKRFEALTGWKGRTSEHARDAGMLVFGAREMWV